MSVRHSLFRRVWLWLTRSAEMEKANERLRSSDGKPVDVPFL